MEAHKHSCLNCGAILISAYCHDCGQKADTHRITLPHLIKHDLVHGLWHFDKGLLFTLREAFLRPGHMAMEYIKGKRVKYYNVFYLLLIVLGIIALTASFFQNYYDKPVEAAAQALVVPGDSVDVSYYVHHYYKLLLFLAIPFFALGGFVSFRKLKLNFAEHAIIAANLLLAGAMWYFFVIAGMKIGNLIESVFFDCIVWGFVLIAWIQPVRVYYQAAHNEYTKTAFALRMLQWFAVLAFFLWIVLRLISAFTGKANIQLT
jgi:hypothetical protein